MSSNATGSDEILVSTTTTEAQYNASVTSLADGGWLVTWQSQNSDGDSIYQTHYDADGKIERQDHFFYSDILPIPVEYQFYSSSVELSDGSWVLAVTPYGLDGSGSGVYQIRFFEDGSQSSFSRVNTYVTGDQDDPVVTALDNGGWLVTWESFGQGSTGYSVYQQRYNNDGDKVGSETLVNTTTDDNQFNPSVTRLADGGWVTTWEYSGTGETESVDQQRYNANGTPKDDETFVATGIKGEASVAALSDGGWLVTWSFSNDGDNVGIYEQRYDVNSDEVGGETQVSADITLYQSDPSVIGLADGGWVVVWQAFDKDGSGAGVYQQRYDASGAKSGGETRVNITTTGDQSIAAVAALADGGWVVTWQSEDGSDGDSDVTQVFQRHFARDIVGTDKADTLIGTNWDEYIIGKAGNDRMHGRGGNDVMAGGGGNDTYIVNSKGDTVDETGGGGVDTIQTSFNWTLAAGFENLTLTGTSSVDGTGNGADNVLTGNSGSNVLTGNGGNDTLNGSGGKDKLIGGAGNDTYILAGGIGPTGKLNGDGGKAASNADVIVEAKNGGDDTVVVGVAREFQLDNIENLKFKSGIDGEVSVVLNEFHKFTLTSGADDLSLTINKLNNTPIQVVTGAGADTVHIAAASGVDLFQYVVNKGNPKGVTAHFDFSDLTAKDTIDLSSLGIKKIISGEVHLSENSGLYLMAPHSTLFNGDGFRFHDNPHWIVVNIADHETPFGLEFLGGGLKAQNFDI